MIFGILIFIHTSFNFYQSSIKLLFFWPDSSYRAIAVFSDRPGASIVPLDSETADTVSRRPMQRGWLGTPERTPRAVQWATVLPVSRRPAATCGT